MAQERAGLVKASELTRSAELALWRSATNFPACEPVGLGVATGDTWVDGHLLPVADSGFDAMASLGPDGYRGAIRVS